MSRTYRPDIDGLRAIAVLLVLVFHFALFPAARAGFIGVDVFFVISGYLITGILTGRLDAGTCSLSSFYVDRVRRLAPALFIVLLLSLVAGAVCLMPTEFESLARQAIASQLYVSNIFYWRTVNYFGLDVHQVYLLHTWSLAVEEQFYVFYPLLLWMVHRHARRHLQVILLVGALVSFGLSLALLHRKPEAVFYLLPTRAWELLTGALVSLRAVSSNRPRAVDEALGLLGMALICAGVCCYRPDISFPGYWALLPVLGTAALIVAGRDNRSRVTRALQVPVLVYIGRISYPLYLVHWPVDLFARTQIEDYSLSWRLAMFALSFVLAILVYHTVEEPVRRRITLPQTSALLRTYVIGVVTTIGLGVLIGLAGGVPQRFPAAVPALAAYVNDRAPPLTECEFDREPPVAMPPLCRIGLRGRDPTWMIYGDSHAWAAHAAFDHWLQERKEAGYFTFRHACPPLLGVHLVNEQDRCYQFNEYVMQRIDSDPSLQHILLVSTWRQAIEGGLSDSPMNARSIAESTRLFATAFNRTVKHLHEEGREVFVWAPVPGAKHDVPMTLARALLHHATPDLVFTRLAYRQNNSYFFDVVKANCADIDGLFSPEETLCATGRCAIQDMQGRPLYFDNAHVTNSTAATWETILNHSVRPECAYAQSVKR